ncbi:TMV resistance protein N-like, partial [Trifolium medium]|nr:TMV resistance protein N-like [Trifolium medium]
RGQDTRETFTSHLHYAFCKQNVVTYIDDVLVKGDDIGSALDQAIHESRISVIVFSKNYATSKWCLNELLKILECRKNNGQVVIPVFYNTDPSDVRKQTGSYREAFAKYEGEAINNESFANTVFKWRTALAEAANIPGWDSQSRTYK